MVITAGWKRRQLPFAFDLVEQCPAKCSASFQRGADECSRVKKDPVEEALPSDIGSAKPNSGENTERVCARGVSRLDSNVQFSDRM